MFEPNVIKAGGNDAAKVAAYYTEEFHREDYYIDSDDPARIWMGYADRLGLNGEVTKKDMESVFAGIHPQTGKSLAGKGGESGSRRPGWDCPFSAPKDVSLLYARGDDKLKEEIRSCHFDAIKQTMDLIQENL